MMLSRVKRAGAVFLLLMVGCSDQVWVSEKELVGTYVMEFDSQTGGVVDYHVKEQFTLDPDHTYIQVCSWYPRHFTNRGTWKTSNHLGGTEVKLARVNLSGGDDLDARPYYDSLTLEVQRQKGKLRLAIYQKADWTYYDRIP
jgi:hypothetical protein